MTEEEIDALVGAANEAHASQTVLDEAKVAVNGPRNQDYGHPTDNHGTTAAMFAAWLRRRYGDRGSACLRLDAIDVCAFNLCQKLSRLANTPDHRDSLVDIAGYVRNWEMILTDLPPEE